MDYKPRYAQPFSLEEATRLDVPVIAEEIARLQNSLSHLKRTQTELQEYLGDSAPDPDLTHALEENATVIGSQEERISILKMALTHKGIFTGKGSHYDLPSQPQGSDVKPTPGESAPGPDDEGDGVYL